MKGFSIIEGNRQIVVTGVEGAGRRSFLSLYYPNEQPVENAIRLSGKCNEVVVVVMLDSCHLQNLAEEAVLKEVATAIKRWKTKTIRLLLVLGRTDLVCSRHQNRAWLEAVMREYRPCLKKIRAKTRMIITHSNLAVKWMRQAMNGEIDADDLNDLAYLLSKAGRRLPNGVSVNNAKVYLSSHLKSLQMLSGEYYAKNFLSERKDK